MKCKDCQKLKLEIKRLKKCIKEDRAYIKWLEANLPKPQKTVQFTVLLPDDDD